MDKNYDIEALLKLPAAERFELADELWTSLTDEPHIVPVTDTQRRELRQRLADYRANPDAVTPVEEVRRRQRTKLEAKLNGEQ